MRICRNVDPAQFLSAPGLWVGLVFAPFPRRAVWMRDTGADLIRIER